MVLLRPEEALPPLGVSLLKTSKSLRLGIGETGKFSLMPKPTLHKEKWQKLEIFVKGIVPRSKHIRNLLAVCPVSGVAPLSHAFCVTAPLTQGELCRLATKGTQSAPPQAASRYPRRGLSPVSRAFFLDNMPCGIYTHAVLTLIVQLKRRARRKIRIFLQNVRTFLPAHRLQCISRAACAI